jgi:hypothetical protein
MINLLALCGYKAEGYSSAEEFITSGGLQKRARASRRPPHLELTENDPIEVFPDHLKRVSLLRAPNSYRHR